jgi:hypothetical protein
MSSFLAKSASALDPTCACLVVPDEVAAVVAETVVLSSATLLCPVEIPSEFAGMAFCTYALFCP